MAAVTEIHSEDFVARVAPGKINRFVGVGTRVRLDIGVVGVEELDGAGNGEAFDAVDIDLAAIITVIREDFAGDLRFRPRSEAFKTGIAFAVFVGEDRTHGGEDVFGNVIFAGDEFEAFALASLFLID